MRTEGVGPSPGVRFAAIWDMVNTDFADMGHGVDLPSRFTARFTIEGDHTVEMDIAVEHGSPVCNGLRVFRAAGRPSLTGHELRRLPLAQWVTFACSMVGFANQGGVKTTDAEWKSEGERQAIERVVRKAGRRNKITAEFLQDVARVYRAAVDEGRSPVEEVRETFGPMGHSTAARYVKLAREGGYLSATTRGKVSD